MVKKLISMIRNHILILLIAPMVGLLLMLLVHLLPTEPMRQNVYWSMGMIEAEFDNGVIIDGYPATLTGNFTDCLMLEYAIYSNEAHSVTEQVLHMYRTETYNNEANPTGWWPGYSLKDYVEGTDQPREVEYGRYWHGYLVILKPLLLCTSFNTIRLLNAALQLILAGCIVIEYTKKNSEILAKAFLISLPFMFFISTFSSLSLSICFYLLAFALLVQVKYDKKLFDKKLYYEYFMLVGVFTAYFDFLTYPLITLAFPLAVYLFWHGKGLKDSIKKIFFASVEWFVGYIGMWASKWILCDLFTDSATIKDALLTISARTGNAAEGSGLIGYVEVIKQNMLPFMNWCYFIIIIFAVVILLINIIKGGCKKLNARIVQGIPFLLIALMPFVWYFATQNHSMEHWQYTCRILSITVFAGIIAAGRITTLNKHTV